MLVLTRRIGEEIVIAGNIYVSVVAVKGDRVRLGISAPDSVPVDRKEVYERRQAFAEIDVPANGYLFYDDLPDMENEQHITCMASR